MFSGYFARLFFGAPPVASRGFSWRLFSVSEMCWMKLYENHIQRKMGADDREWRNLVEEAEEATQSLCDQYYKGCLYRLGHFCESCFSYGSKALKYWTVLLPWSDISVWRASNKRTITDKWFLSEESAVKPQGNIIGRSANWQKHDRRSEIDLDKW